MPDSQRPEQKDSVHEELAERLRWFMDHQDHAQPITHEDLSQATGLTPNYIRRVVAGDVGGSTRMWSVMLATARPPEVESHIECGNCGRPYSAHYGVAGRDCPGNGIMFDMETGAEVARWGSGRATTFCRVERTADR